MVFQPKLQEYGEIVWHLRRNLSNKIKDVMTIGIYDGRALLIKYIRKLARRYACMRCKARFTKVRYL